MGATAIIARGPDKWIVDRENPDHDRDCVCIRGHGSVPRTPFHMERFKDGTWSAWYWPDQAPSRYPMLTAIQQRILDAVKGGALTYRDIKKIARVSTTSLVAHSLRRLAELDHIILEEGPRGMQVYDASDYCQAWDTAARLAGNEEA